MPRPRKTEPGQQPQETAPQQPDSAVSETTAAGEAPQNSHSQWGTRIGGGWTDAEAGVHLLEDHLNRRMTIRFDEKPSETVRKFVKEEHGYSFDGQNQLWYKRINPATARQHRTEAEQVAFHAANMIRQEKGLQEQKSFFLGF